MHADHGINGTTDAQKLWWVANHMNGGGDHTGNTPYPLLPDYMGGEVMLSNDTTTSTVYTLVPPVTFQHWGSFYEGQFDQHPEWYSLLHKPQLKDDDSPCHEHHHHGRHADAAACVRTHNLSGTTACGPAPGKDNTAYPFAQLCMSNPAMRQYMIHHTVAKLTWDRAHIQDHSLVNIAGNDQCADSECHCHVCSAARQHDAPDSSGSVDGSHVPYAGQSGLNLAVANELASALDERGFPETHVMLQIYKGTLTPPRRTKPHPQVLLQFTTEGYAPKTRNAIQPLTHPSNSLTLQQLVGWRDLTTSHDQLHIWEYIGNFCHATILQPDWWRAFQDAKMFGQQHQQQQRQSESSSSEQDGAAAGLPGLGFGVGGILSEGQSLPTADLHELRSWVLSSLYWDATRDIDSLITEFLVGFYSAEAAPLVLKHMEAYRDFTQQTNASASGCGCDPMSNACVTVPVLFESFDGET